MHKPRWVRPTRRRAIGWLATVGTASVLAGAVFAVTAGAVPTYLDLTTTGASGTVNGALIVQGVGPAGTGQFDPFLTMQTTPTETGYNSDAASADSDATDYPSGRTHPLAAAAVPQVTIGGVKYREFAVDSNDPGSDSYMSIDQIKIFLDNQNNLKGYTDGTESFANDDGSHASKIYDLGDNVILMRSQGLSSGSGEQDVTVFVPDSAFPSECSYGSTTCNKWVVFYTKMGAAGTLNVGSGCSSGCNYDTKAGFEEWRTRKLPVVSVSKTAVPTFTRSYDWTVSKQVSLNGTDWADAQTLNLFNGQSSTVYWKIDSTRGAPQDGNASVSGTVTVTNPTGSGIFTFGVDAVVNSVSDVIKQSGFSDTNVTLSCGTLPKTLKAGQSLQCTYNTPVAQAADGTNTATATLSTGDSYKGSAAINFSSATPTEVDATASLDDDRDPALPKSLSGNDSLTYNETLGCGSSRTITNTAALTETDSHVVRNDSASVDIHCYGLNVSKTATPSFTRTYGWTIKKYVSLDGTTFEDASVAFKQFDGDSKTIYWKLVPTRDAGTDSAWHVTGTITVSNPAPIDATGVEVSDSIAGVGAATVDCDPNTGGNQTTVNIPASGSVDCTYSADLPDATTRLNTGKATLAGNDYTGTKSINFTGVSPTEVNATATLSDTNKGALGDATSGQSVQYTTDVACGIDRTITNTGTVHFGSSTATDDAAVTVDCLQLTVTKTATPSFTRTWTWQVAKSATNSELTLALGETYFQPYSVVYTATSQDSDWNVSGTITVSSPAGAPTRQVTVSDVYAGNTATVDCTGGLPQMLAGGGTINCTYSVDLPSALNGNNVATATLTNVPSGTTDFASNSAGVTFSNPTTETDETIAVSDTVPAGSYCTGVNAPIVGCTAGMVGTGPPSGNVSASDSPKTFTYTRIIGPYGSGQCGTQTVDNTASFTTNDTAATGDSSWEIVVTIPCPTGCTLTQGYWKTHSILGPAPFDDAWNNIPTPPYAPASIGTAEGLMFFFSTQTWYQVFWTPPKGGNAYYILAHQYEAAVLNYLNGADATAIFPTLDAALALFNNPQNTPDKVGKLKNADRQVWINLAGILGSYNEGTIGPGHCDEDSTRSTSE